MREKTNVRVLLPATQRFYEFRIPHDLDISTTASLVAQLVSLREAARFKPSGHEALMLMEGERAGTLLDGSRTVRHFVCEGVITRGSRLALM